MTRLTKQGLYDLQIAANPILHFIFNCALSGIIVAVVSEVAKRSPAFGALIVSLPLVSPLVILRLWRDTADAARIASHAESTFWYVLPSLPMFPCSRRCFAPVSVSGPAWARLCLDHRAVSRHRMVAGEVRDRPVRASAPRRWACKERFQPPGPAPERMPRRVKQRFEPRNSRQCRPDGSATTWDRMSPGR